MRWWWTVAVVLCAPEPGAGDGGGAPAGGAGGAGGGQPEPTRQATAPRREDGFDAWERESHGEGAIPRARFRELYGDFQRMRSEHEAAQRRAAELAPLAERASKLEKDLGAERARWEEEKALVRHGFVDDEAIDAARYAYSRLPEKERPALGDWLADLKKDPTKAPKILGPFLGSPEPSGDGSAGAGHGQGQGRRTEGTARPAPAGSTVTVEALAAARDKGLRTGDWKAFEALNAAFQEEKRARR